MNQSYDKKINEELFSIDFESDFSEEKADKLIDLAEELVNKFGEEVVFNEWFEYLKNINDKKSARNFMFSFCDYDGLHFKIKDPYPFLGTLLYKAEFSLDNDPDTEEEENKFNIFDGIYIELLLSSNIITLDEYFDMNPYYDEKLIKAYNDAKELAKKYN